MKNFIPKRNFAIGQYKFAPVLLLMALFPLFLTSCSDTDNEPNAPECEKVVLVFGIDQGEGDLSVTLMPEVKITESDNFLKSPAEIKKGSKVKFTATHSKSWEIKYWKINGIIIRSVDPIQDMTINEHTDVRIAFKPWSPK